MKGKLTNLSLALAAALLITGCDLFKKDSANAAAGAPRQMPPAKVDVTVAKKGDYAMSFNYPARVQSEQDVVIKPKVSGTLLKQNFKAGDRVKQGQILFVIDPEKYRASYEALEASIAQSQANLKNAKSELERVKNLFKQKAVSQKEYDSALASYETAEATLKSAQASAKSAKLDLEYTNVTAPFSGVVGENLIDAGAYVAAGSTELVRLTKIDPIDVRFYISDVDSLNRAQNLAGGTWAQINEEAVLQLNGKEYKGKVKFIDSTVDTSSGSVLAKAEFENKGGELLPGVFGRIQMDGFIQKNSFKIPQIAVLQDTVSPYVYVVKDGKVTKKSVKIVYQTVTEAYVSEGLDEGDVIILNNFKKIGVGAPVQPDERDKTASGESK